MNKGILNEIQKAFETNKKLVSVLIDPDTRNFGQLGKLLTLCNQKPIDFLLIGGSLLSEGNIEDTISFVKEKSSLPIIIFPGTTHQISSKADAIFLLSLVSGRNPELLIGKHVESSFRLKASGLEIVPTGYMLIDSGKPTTASYISFSPPLPADKPMLAAATALAAQQLGMKVIYMDGGSGADQPISEEIIKTVRKQTSLPLIVGGGLKNKNAISIAFEAGADMVVIGNALEQNPELLNDLF
ncbi:MAG: geranylgeranylglyceryl/heptaprenylglyceryl phosphate synthase [Bacteroidia bacterium]